MVKKILVLTSVVVLVISGLMLSSCAKKAVAPEVATAPGMSEEEKARLEREKQEAALREQKLREEQEKARLREEFQGKKIYFAFDSAVLTEESQATLKEKNDYLAANSNCKVTIEGHCDERGSVEYNLALGQRRADSAKKYLVMLGISAERLHTVSYGKERPVDPGHNEEAWAKNRRDEFVLNCSE
jgi:peptidoglycan-associated lipoprotein